MLGLVFFSVRIRSSCFLNVMMLTEFSTADSNIRLHENEMNEDFRHKPGLVRLSDGSGIYGTVAVFHSIHCIKRLRYLLHFDHYHANATEKQAMELKLHGGA